MTNRQIVFLLFLTMIGTSIINLPRVFNELAGTSGWIFLLGLALFFAISHAMLVRVNVLFEGQTLYEYGKPLLGKPLLYAVIILLLLYGLAKTALMSTNIGLMVKYSFLPRTPLTVLTLSICAASAFLAYKGILASGRVLEIYGFFELIFFLSVVVLILFQGSWDYLIPVFDSERIVSQWQGSYQLLPAFHGAEVLLMIPLSRKINGKAPKITFLAVLGISALAASLCLSAMMVIGPNALKHFEYPLVVAIRRLNIDFMPFLSRMDTFFITIGLSGFYCTLGMAFLFVVELLCKLFAKVKRGWVVLVTTLVTVVCGVILYETNTVNLFHKIINIFAPIGVSFVLPVTLFILTKVKKLEKKTV